MTRTTRGVVILVTTIVVVTAVVLVAMSSGGDESSTATTTSTTRAPEPAASTSTTFVFPATHTGDVWVTASSPEGEAATVVLTWGPWRREVTHSGGTATYRFTKGLDPEGAESPPIEVVAPDGVEVEVGYGVAPDDAIPVDDDWYEWEELPAEQ